MVREITSYFFIFCCFFVKLFLESEDQSSTVVDDDQLASEEYHREREKFLNGDDLVENDDRVDFDFSNMDNTEEESDVVLRRKNETVKKPEPLIRRQLGTGCTNLKKVIIKKKTNADSGVQPSVPAQPAAAGVGGLLSNYSSDSE